MGYFPFKYYLEGEMRLNSALAPSHLQCRKKKLGGDKNKIDKVWVWEVGGNRQIFDMEINQIHRTRHRLFQNLPRQPDKPLMVFNHNIYLTWISSNLKATVLLALSNTTMGTYNTWISDPILPLGLNLLRTENSVLFINKSKVVTICTSRCSINTWSKKA